MKTNHQPIVLTLFLNLICLSLPGLGAVDMFLKIEGENSEGLQGESTDNTHANEIDVLAWSWGATQPGTTHLGAGGGAGKANFQDLSFTKWIDKSSVGFLKNLTTGARVGKATLTVRSSSGDNFLTLVIEDILVTSVSTGGSGGEDRLTANVTLNFSKFTVTYFPTDDSTDPTFTHDIAANAGS